MPPDTGGPDPIAVLIAALLNMVVAALWYSPILLGKPWTSSVGADQEVLRAAAGRGYAIAAVASLVAAFTLASSAAAYGIEGFFGGALLGLEYGIGLVAMYVLSIMAFEARPLRLAFIDAGYAAVALAAMGGLLGAW